MQFTKFTSESRVMQGRWFAKPSRAAAFAYHPDGRLARVDYGNGKTEEFLWDGLALVKRGDEQFVNEPHIGGGAPVVSSKGTAYFNDILGATVGAKRGRKYSVAALTAFGEGDVAFFTGNPPCSRPRAHISLPELPPRPRQVADRRPARLPRRLEFARVLQQQFGCRYGLARMLC